MPTRRHMIGGIILAAAGGGALSAGAFTTDASADADMRVVVVSDLRLEPARDDGAYVSRTTAGELLVNFDTTEQAGGLNRDAYSGFDQLITVLNNGTVGYDELVFSFAVPESTAESLPPERVSALVDAMEIISTHDVTATDGDFIIEQELAPGDEVVFGIGVDLLPRSDTDLPDLDDGIDLELTITATQET